MTIKLFVVAVFVCSLTAVQAQDKTSSDAVSAPAQKLHDSALVIDTHADTPQRFLDEGFDIGSTDPNDIGHISLDKARRGNLGAEFFSIWVEPETNQGHFARHTFDLIDSVYQQAARHPDRMMMAFSTVDIERAHREHKLAALMGIEGGHSIEADLHLLRDYYRLGVRYMTLTHTETLDWADSATDEPRHGGLTSFGEQVVAEMNRLGMMVDISHVSADTMRQALRVSKAPVIASHSSAYALTPHPRNVPDDVLALIAKSGGVVMVNFYPGFLTPEGARASKDMFRASRDLRARYPDDRDFQAAMSQWQKEHPVQPCSVRTVVDHIEHIIKVAGIDHVGLGSDFDGITTVPRQLEDVSCYPYLTQELLNRGYSSEQIHKVLGQNLLRAFRQVEQVARGMQ